MWRTEQAILMTVMENPRLTPILVNNIGRDSGIFKNEHCKRIYLAIKTLHEEKKITFLVVVMEKVGKEVPQNFYDSMAETIRGVHPSEFQKFLIQSIENLIWERKKKQILSEVYKEINSNVGDPKRVIELAKKLQVSAVTKETGDFIEANEEYLKWITQTQTGINLGIPTFDRAIDCLNMGELVVICGRPTTGKTWLAFNAIQNIKKHTNHIMGLFSIEMAKPAVIERMKQLYFGITRFDLKKATRGDTINDTEFLNLFESLAVFTHSYSVSEIANIIREEMIEIAVIDFLNIIRAEVGGKRYEKTTQLILDLKMMAKEENVLVILLAQLSRAGGDGSIPVTMDMIRDSGQIEEVADFILGLSRKDIAGPEALGNKYEEEKDVIYAVLLKNKRGSSRRVKIYQDPRSGKMRELGSTLEAKNE